MNEITSSTNEPKTDFWAMMAKLDAEVKRFETAVDSFCEAKKEFISSL